MKKKKIIFSSSGGTPAMKLLRCLIENFGNADIEHVAAQIAATCRKTALVVWTSMSDGIHEFHGSTAKSIDVSSGTLILSGENIAAENNILYIHQI